ncbi:HCO3- transporter family domain containing protein [Lactarius tabidus]
MPSADEKHFVFTPEPQESPTVHPTTAAGSRGGGGGGGGEAASSSTSETYAPAGRTSRRHHRNGDFSCLRSWIPVNVGAGICARAPWYWSDWTDAWNYRVIPATALILFANVLPGIAFSQHLTVVTGKYGVSEVLLSSFMASVVFSVFGAQPLCIAGVTGCNFLQYVTVFSCETFGFYVAWTYLQFGIQALTYQFGDPAASPSGALVSVTLALLMLVAAFLFKCLSQSALFHRHVRRSCADYGIPLALVASSAVAYWGSFHTAHPSTLPVGAAFQPAHDRPWLVRFWQLDGKWVALALPFGIILWVLFFFDHNVSSPIAQGSQFPLRKPAGFHYDFTLLGVTTFLAGLLGVPAPNRLIPQAPIHTRALLVHGLPQKAADEELPRVEPRAGIAVSPFLHVLNLVPQGVIVGLFWYMGLNELSENGITQAILTDHMLTPSTDPLRRVRKSRILLYAVLQLAAFGATFAITQTVDTSA